MRFKIKEIGEDGLKLDLPITAAFLAEECPDLGGVPESPGVWLRGQLLQPGEDVFLRGRLRGPLLTTCSRCLEKAIFPLNVEVNVSFIRKTEGDEAADDEEEGDVDVAYFDGEEVDLAPEIRDQIVLAFPINPLCKEDCAGLCAVCGGNRNQTPCSCATRESLKDNPLAAALGKLKLS